MEHRKPSVVVVDDYPLFRKGIADALTTNANFQILGLTGDEKTALSLIGLKPDIVIIDLDAKGFQPLNLLRLIKYRQPSCRAVMLMSSPNSSSNLMQAIRLDANGYLLRNIPIDEFVDQMKIVAQGGMAASEKLPQPLLSTFVPARLRSRKRTSRNFLPSANSKCSAASPRGSPTARSLSTSKSRTVR